MASPPSNLICHYLDKASATLRRTAATFAGSVQSAERSDEIPAISFDELKDLRRDFSIAEIRSVLLDMENKTNIETAFRSCAKTARHWLEHRKNR